MNDLAILNNAGTEAVKRLRKKKLSAGKPFMINSKDLPGNQGYLEYPDHSINLVAVSNDERSFTIIRQLTIAEAQSIRDRFNL